jgi:formylglycine-generating enzyme required for sulfatase activity
MVVLPAGTFTMGSPEDEPGRNIDEGPQHKLALDEFAIGRHEVTFAEYDAFCEATGREKPDDQGWGRGRRPVINVSWEDARAYAQWLSEESGANYRLPTEAEWEYAARAESDTAYAFGNAEEKLDAYAWYFINSGGKAHPVGGKKPNPWGLHDLHGNVWEWVNDWYADDYYQNSPGDNPSGPDTGVVPRDPWRQLGQRPVRPAFRESEQGTTRPTATTTWAFALRELALGPLTLLPWRRPAGRPRRKPATCPSNPLATSWPLAALGRKWSSYPAGCSKWAAPRMKRAEGMTKTRCTR